MRKLIMCRGLPASGKSTWAQRHKDDLEKIGVRCVIVTKDDIREKLEKTGWLWSPENEREVIDIRNRSIKDAFERGVPVVISADTNFGKHHNALHNLATALGAEFEIKDFTQVPVGTCIERDSKREKAVGADVIQSMHDKYLSAEEPVLYAPKDGTPLALICDIDGTVAIKGDRSPYDYSKVGLDTLNTPIADIVKLHYAHGFTVLFLSGRDDSCYGATKTWLQNYGFIVDHLFMRKTGDRRKDSIVKLELFNTHIRDNFNVQFVLDDRDQVVKMWRSLGLTCLQVAEGNF